MKRIYCSVFAILFCVTSCFAATTITATTTTSTTAVTTPATPVTQAPIPSAMPTVGNTPTIIPTAPNLGSAAYVLMDANTGMILAHKNMREERQPASLTKLMTLYLTFQALKNNQIHLTDNVRISKKAWATGGSRMFVKEGSLVSVQELMNGIVVASGNDASTALAQYVGGNEATFVTMMNVTAKQLGMKGTHYADPTGLPAPGHVTTAYDMALLTRAIIIGFPQYYANFKQGWITYDNIKQPNTNRLLWRDHSVDGLKTGHTQAAGYCLISSALRHGMRLISVVMGSPNVAQNMDDSEALLNWGYRFYSTHKLFEANKSLATPNVYLGKSGTVPVGLATPLYVTIQAGNYSHLTPKVDITKLEAPIQKGQTVGMLNIYLHKNIVASASLIALESDAKGNMVMRAWDRMERIF